MRRIAPLLLPVLLLTGCASYVGNPADGLGGFLGDTFSWRGNTNRPAIDSPNGQRVAGGTVEVEPLQSETGNIWPGPLPPARTMAEMQQEMTGLPLPIDAHRAGSAPAYAPPASGPPASGPPASGPPASGPPATPRATAPAGTPRSTAPAMPPAVAPAPASRVLQTPSGPATTVIGSNGVETYTLPSGRTGIVMPNANGTLTLIGPDGSTQTIPAPR